MSNTQLILIMYLYTNIKVKVLSSNINFTVIIFMDIWLTFSNFKAEMIILSTRHIMDIIKSYYDVIKYDNW